MFVRAWDFFKNGSEPGISNIGQAETWSLLDAEGVEVAIASVILPFSSYYGRIITNRSLLDLAANVTLTPCTARSNATAGQWPAKSAE